MGVGEAGDPVGRGGEQHPVPVPGGGDAECGGEVGFAGSGRAEQHDVAGLGEEPAGGQRGDLLADGGLGVEVEVLQGLAGGEPGGPDPQLGAGGVAGGDFPFQHRGEVVLVGPAGVAGLVGQPGGGLGDPRGLERGGQVVDLLERCRWRSWAVITRPRHRR